MMDAELGREWCRLSNARRNRGTDLGVLLGRDHGAAPGTRDGSARAGATRSRGHRPWNATLPPGERSAPEPSTCRQPVCGAARRAGKSDPSRARDTRAGDPDDQGGLQGSRDAVGAQLGPSPGVRRSDTAPSNRRGRNHTTDRSRRNGYNADRFSAAAGCPRRRSDDVGRLDITRTTVAQQSRSARSVGASRRSPRVWRDQLQTLTSFAAPRSVRDPGPLSNPEAMDAATPADAQNAPTGVWKTVDGFPQIG
jgi:hypothetical protein